ncbi:hypothetical protein B566_EDAN016198 [Ephemera danica]|nr:hypothetical protein B566_EDAN016198 [Ephemera danica]
MTSICEDVFGSIDEGGTRRDVKRFTLTSSGGAVVQITEYGATVTSIRVPDRSGNLADVTMGFDTLDGYTKSPVKPYFGAIIGRVANRIGKGQFQISGKKYQVSLNRGTYHLHGGNVGFDKLTLSYLSTGGEEGYPGQVLTHVTYWLSELNELHVEMLATATKPTPVNLTNHAYFNLAGHAAGAKALVVHPGSGRILEVYSDQPGVQFYTSNFLPQDDILKGISGAVYNKHGSFCLETQNFPDAVNHPTFPNSVVLPGQIYLHNVTYRFSTL